MICRVPSNPKHSNPNHTWSCLLELPILKPVFPGEGLETDTAVVTPNISHIMQRHLQCYICSGQHFLECTAVALQTMIPAGVISSSGLVCTATSSLFSEVSLIRRWQPSLMEHCKQQNWPTQHLAYKSKYLGTMIIEVGILHTSTTDSSLCFY